MKGFRDISNGVYEKKGQFYKKVGNIFRFYSFPSCKVPKMVGIYYIRNTLNDTYYIGASADLVQRVSSHKAKFKLFVNKPNKKFINKLYAFGLCFGDRFMEYGLLELCSIEDLQELERYYIRLADSVNNGMNGSYTTTRNHVRYKLN